MAKWVLEIDTEDITSVINVYIMMRRLLEFWKKTIPDTYRDDMHKAMTNTDDTQTVREVSEEGKSQA